MFLLKKNFLQVCNVFYSDRNLRMLRRTVCSLQIEAAGFSETTVNLYQTTRRHIPEDNILYSPP